MMPAMHAGDHEKASGSDWWHSATACSRSSSRCSCIRGLFRTDIDPVRSRRGIRIVTAIGIVSLVPLAFA
jgi:hypothetical protein